MISIMTLNILWNSDRIIGGYSAYSKVSNQCCTRLAKLGHRVAHIPMGMANRMGEQMYEDVLIYKSGASPWNEDIALDRYNQFNADMFIALKETWVFNNIHKLAMNFVPYVPIDHSPVSPTMLSRLHTAFKVIVPSRFAQRELKKAGIENVVYVPHGVDTGTYRILEGRKTDCKKQWYVDPDDFTVLMVSMNRSRKLNARQFRIYQRFREMNPDVKSHLMFWGNMMPAGGQGVDGAVGLGVSDVGVNLIPEVLQLGLGEAITWPDQGMIREGIPEWSGEDYEGGWDMVKLYNMADALLHCTGGEGFGLPLIEAQACGVPVVTTDYAGGPEQVGVGSIVPANDYIIINTPGVRRALPDIDKGAEALTKIMNSNPEKLAKRARRYSMRFDWERVIDTYFKPFLEECELELYPKITKEGVSKW